jgi:hypothetical protein
MGAEGMRRAHERYTWRIVAERTAAVYEDAAENAVSHSEQAYMPAAQSILS